MLTHDEVHYLVGLLWRFSRYGSQEVILGDMIFDKAAEKERDVDITVRYKVNNTDCALLGIEVKDEKEALGVIKVESLCSKLADMPSVTKKGIVSASGFSDGAINKARYHGVDLYELLDWDVKNEDPDFLFKFSPELFWRIYIYDWVDEPLVEFNQGETPNGEAQKALAHGTPIINKDEKIAFKDIYGLCQQIVQESRDLSFYKHMDDLNLQEGESREIISNIRNFSVPMFAKVNGTLYPIRNFRIRGTVTKTTEHLEPHFKKLTCIGNNQFKLGCVVTKLSKSNLMVAFIEPDSNQLKTVGIVIDRQKNKRIYKIPLS